MSTQKNSPEQGPNDGFIKIILAVVVLVVILSLLKIDIRSLLESEAFKTNFAYVGDLAKQGWDWFLGFWNDHLKEPAIYLWDLILTNAKTTPQ
ncbi:MAG: hypothetical protein K8Q91_01985 [Candidatus Vogelbacteria bacterium]|jgi:hypothetical protein|nr:hypothetical protein [Candidatus Vogelbacteria bacterium]